MSKPVILITGATSGFGAATARKFASNGWKVIATGRRTERLQALCDEFDADTILPLQIDLTSHQSISDAISAIPSAFQPIKCLFNNGGLALGSAPMPDIDLADWRRMIDTNIFGLIHMTHEALDLVKTAGAGASIINVGSIAGRYPYPGGNVYGASKAFVRQFSFELRCDLEGSGIRVTSLEPGMAKTEFTAVRHHGDFEKNESFYEGVDPILPQDIAETVWFIANQPAHININAMEIMPTCQVPGAPKAVRST